MACHQVKGQQRNGDKVYAEVGRKRNGKAGSIRRRARRRRTCWRGMNKLIVYLLEQGRNKDLAKAASDSEYQAKLLKELGL